MNTRLLYKVFGAGILIVIGVFLLLQSIEPKTPHANSGPIPETSALSELEFESGVLAKKLESDQEDELTRYHGDAAKDQFVSVPLNRAIDAYLDEHRDGVSE